jgi:hypothetical protein
MAAITSLVLCQQLAARLVVRLGLQRGRRQRPAQTTSAAAARRAIACAPRRRTARSPARATTPTCRRRPTASRRACRCTCGAACQLGPASSSAAGEVESRSAHASFGRPTSTSSAEVVVDDGGESPNDGCEPPVSDVEGQDRADRPRQLHLRGQGGPRRGRGRRRGRHRRQRRGRAPDRRRNDTATRRSPRTTRWPRGRPQGRPRAGGQTRAQSAPRTGAERDGTIDNMIVAHEWGHYLHHRLVDCGKSPAGESEGWGDFNALHMALREGDDLDGSLRRHHLRQPSTPRRTSGSAASRTRSISRRTRSASGTSPTARRSPTDPPDPGAAGPTARSTTPARSGRR